MPILALICRMQVEKINVMESASGPLVLALRSLRFLSASQILFFHRELLLLRNKMPCAMNLVYSEEDVPSVNLTQSSSPNCAQRRDTGQDVWSWVWM